MIPDLDNIAQLRAEKRAIAAEEKRLRALLVLEKDPVLTDTHARRDAEIANRKRQQEKFHAKRNMFKDTLEMILQEEAILLKYKHGVDITTERPEFRVPVVQRKPMSIISSPYSNTV